ncbi:hypothetical protein [Saccharothrix sp.]|uniref:hypothetical protein n=1 Tax=Saccharothrix sp. TaxID=1873460 RepID=UPI00281160AE|nr:hypothetical protein [Saccharothrix sp.]
MTAPYAPPPYPPPQPASRTRPVVVVLALLVVLALGAAGTMAALWNDARQDRTTASRALDDATRQVDDRRAELSDTRKAIQETTEKISSLESENAELHKCADPAKDSIIAARDGNQPALAAAIDRVEVACR